MKKFILTAAAGIALCAACNAQSDYRITGNVAEEIQTNKAYLVAIDGNKMDTLASADVVNGKFEIKGSTGKDIKFTVIMLDGIQGGMPVFLEGGEFTATITNDYLATKVEGTGAAQKLFNQFTDIQRDFVVNNQPIQMELMAAQVTGDKEKRDSLQGEYGKLAQAAQAKEVELIKANPDSYVMTYMLANSMSQMELDAVKERFAILTEAAKANEWGKQIADYIALQERIAIGAIAPDFTTTDSEGKEFNMHSVKGKVKLLDFWASWCMPCRGENPKVVAIYKEFHDKGLEIISISVDDNKDAWLKAVEEDGLIWRQCADQDAAELYGIRVVPTTFLLDENNKIVAKNLRGDELKAKIAEMLK